MNNILNQIVLNFQNENQEINENVKNKVLQEIVLSGLSRTDFFKKCALFGNSAFSIFYGNEFFENTLNFVLCSANLDLNINEYLPAIKNEFESLGFEILSVKIDNKNNDLIEVCFEIKSVINIFNFADNLTKESFSESEDFVVKFVIDFNAPKFALFEVKFGFEPYPYHVKMYDLSTLLADKIQALLCQNISSLDLSKNLYDYFKFFNFGENVNLKYLKEKLVKANFIDENFDLTIDNLKQFLYKKFDMIDFEKLKKDNLDFNVIDKNFEVWGKEYFVSMIENLRGI